jgi:hypothetical protein
VDWHLLLIGFFLPLFPLSLGINILLARLPSAWAKATVLLVWPQIGVFLVAEHIGDLPDWIKFWGLATAGLYAFRMLAMREVNLWIGFLATSSWALLWTPAFKGLSLPELEVLALGFGLPLAIMALLSGEIAKRFGAAYIRSLWRARSCHASAHRGIGREPVRGHCDTGLPGVLCDAAHAGDFAAIAGSLAGDHLGDLELGRGALAAGV